MTKKELIKSLDKYPDNMEVFIDERATEFRYGLLNSVRSKEIVFMEEPEGEPLAEAEVIILCED